MNNFKDIDLGYLLDLGSCTTCGGELNLDYDFCPYCGNKQQKWKEKFEKTEQFLKENMNIDIPFDITNAFNFIIIYSIRNKTNSSYLKDFLSTQKIKEKIDTFMSKINQKILNEEKLNMEENYIFLNLLTYNVLSSDEILGNNIIRNVFLKKPLVDEHVFLAIVKDFVVVSLKQLNQGRIINYNPTCIIRNLNLNNNENNDTYICGDSLSYKEIRLDTSRVLDIYNGNILAFQTIFHEMTHVIDEIDKKTGVFSSDIIRHIQDELIAEIERTENLNFDKETGYYKKNYQLVSFEKDAQINGWIYFLRYLDNLNLEISNELRNDIMNKVTVELEQKKNLLRNFSYQPEKNSDMMLLDDIFDYYIKDYPLYLERYPQLKIGYILDDGIVRSKTKEELINTCLMYDGNIEVYNYINQRLIQLEDCNTKNIGK